MNLTLLEYESSFNDIDPRAMRTIRDFLRVKVQRYAHDFGWDFDEGLHTEGQGEGKGEEEGEGKEEGKGEGEGDGGNDNKIR